MINIEALIDNMCRDRGITREQFDKEVEDGKQNSVVGNLENVANIEALQMEMIDQLGFMIGELTQKVYELEAKLNA